MAVTTQDVSSALAELGRLRFGEMKVEDAMHEIVRSTHAIFDVDGAGLMVAEGMVAAADDTQLRVVAPTAENVPQGAPVWLYMPPDGCRLLSG